MLALFEQDVGAWRFTDGIPGMAVWACFDKTDREKGGYWLVVFEFKLSG